MGHACKVCKQQAKYKVFTYDGQTVYLCEKHIKGWHSKRIAEMKTFGETMRDIIKDGWKIKENPRFYSVESWKRMFWFTAKFPKVLFFTVLVQLIMFAGISLIFLQTSYVLFNESSTSTLIANSEKFIEPAINLSSYLSLWQKIADSLGTVPILSNPWVGLFVGFIIIIFAFLIGSSSYPTIVSYGFEQSRIDLAGVFKEARARILDVSRYILVMAGIVFVFPIGAWLSATIFITTLAKGIYTLVSISGTILGLIYVIAIIYVSFKLSFELGSLIVFAIVSEILIFISPYSGIVFVPVLFIIMLYLSVRLSLVLPVLMIEKSPEGKKLRLKEGFSDGIAYTNGKLRSILGMWVLLFITVFVPLCLIFWFILAPISITSYWVAVIWAIIVQELVGTFQAILPTVYYFTTIQKMKL